MFISLFMIGESILGLIEVLRSCRKRKKTVEPEKEDENQIQNVLQQVTHLTTLALEDRKNNKYEESKQDITLEDISRYRRNGKIFKMGFDL
jgi:hypothetical protein